MNMKNIKKLIQFEKVKYPNDLKRMIDLIVGDCSNYFSIYEDKNTITLYVLDIVHNTLIMNRILDRLEQIKTI